MGDVGSLGALALLFVFAFWNVFASVTRTWLLCRVLPLRCTKLSQAQSTGAQASTTVDWDKAFL